MPGSSAAVSTMSSQVATTTMALAPTAYQLAISGSLSYLWHARLGFSLSKHCTQHKHLILTFSGDSKQDKIAGIWGSGKSHSLHTAPSPLPSIYYRQVRRAAVVMPHQRVGHLDPPSNQHPERTQRNLIPSNESATSWTNYQSRIPWQINRNLKDV